MQIKQLGQSTVKNVIAQQTKGYLAGRLALNERGGALMIVSPNNQELNEKLEGYRGSSPEEPFTVQELLGSQGLFERALPSIEEQLASFFTKGTEFINAIFDIEKGQWTFARTDNPEIQKILDENPNLPPQKPQQPKMLKGQ